MSTTINIPVINKSSNKLPEYAHKGDAGFDLRANVEEIENSNYLFNAIILEVEYLFQQVYIWQFLKVMNFRFVLVVVWL